MFFKVFENVGRFQNINSQCILHYEKQIKVTTVHVLGNIFTAQCKSSKNNHID